MSKVKVFLVCNFCVVFPIVWVFLKIYTVGSMTQCFVNVLYYTEWDFTSQLRLSSIDTTNA